MAAVNLQSFKNNLAGLGQRKIKAVYLLLALSAAFSLLVIGWAYAVINYRSGPAQTDGSPPAVSGQFTYRYAVLGENENMLVKPMDLVVKSDRLYVTDTLNTRVQVFTLTGDTVFTFGSLGTAPGEFSFPYGIEIAADGNIYVADSYNGNISVFDKSGSFLNYFAVHEEKLTQPAAMYLKGKELYVTNLDPGYVLVFNVESGELLRQIGSEGEGLGQLLFPNDVVIGPDGNIYVSDTGNNRIQVYTITGEFIKTMDIDSNLIYSPRGIAFSSKDHLVIASKLNNDITVWDLSGKQLSRFGDDVFNLPNGIALDSKGRLYVTDHISVLVFD
jgi:DNA-binding beta-propeller fold protein YncE